MKRGYVLKEKSKDKKNKKRSKKWKIWTWKTKDHESVQVKMPLLFTLCIIMILCNFLFMPESMVIKLFNLDYAML